MVLRSRKEMIILALMTFIMAFTIMSFDSQAANKIINLKSDVDILVSPEDGADVLVSFKKGEPVFITGTQGEYYVVLYQGQNGYFKSSVESDDNNEDVVLEEAGDENQGEHGDSSDSAVVNELNDEFDEAIEETEYIFEVEDNNSDMKKGYYIWGGIIVAIIILIFVLSIIGNKENIKRQKASKKRKKQKREKGVDIIDLDKE